MIGFASRTGTRATLAALLARGWGLLVSASGRWNRHGFKLWCADNGAWSVFTQGGEFDDCRYGEFLDWCADQEDAPLFVALPDEVMNAAATLRMSTNWFCRIRDHARWRKLRFALVVQDGMSESDVIPFLQNGCSIFVGGSIEWKLATVRQWADLAHAYGTRCHVGRVNSSKRIHVVGAAGADSFDGTSATKFLKTLKPLDQARHSAMLARGQGDFWR